MTSRSKKGTQIYSSFLSKVWQTNPLQVPQEGPYREGGPLTGHFAYLSKTSSFGFPSKGALPEAPSTDPLEREMPHPQSPYGRRCLSLEPFLNIFQGPQQGSPLSRFPLRRSHRERHSTPRAPFNHISKSLVDEPTPGCPTEPP